MTKNDPLDNMQEVKSNWIKFGKIGDFVKGTLVSVRDIKSTLPGQEGKMNKVYELLTDAGSFHTIFEDKTVSKDATVVNPEEYWNVAGKPGIDSQMRNVKYGTIVAFRFSEEKPSKTKGFNPNKVIKVLVGGPDPEYMGQTSEDHQ